MSLVVGQRLGPYEVLALLGTGGMGEVYRARDTSLGRVVALKILPDGVAHDRDRLARFEREAKTLASLNHPNIAQIYGVEAVATVSAGEAGSRALVMELVEGEDLAWRLARGAVPIDEAIAIGRQIADALEAAHEQGIVHRDLKPANVKVRDDGTVKVLDFGLAKALDPASGPLVGLSLAHSPSPRPQLAALYWPRQPPRRPHALRSFAPARCSRRRNRHGARSSAALLQVRHVGGDGRCGRA